MQARSQSRILKKIDLANVPLEVWVAEIGLSYLNAKSLCKAELLGEG